MTLGRRYRMRAALLAVGMACAAPWLLMGQTQGSAVAIDPDDIGGTVTSAKGPEAGVWVIAETTETPTKFAKVVVTDDQGRYVVPDLPRATYQVFVRGYGLVDSPRVPGKPGQQLDLKAVIAPDAKAAAQVYPAGWWMSMMKIPEGHHGSRRSSSRPRRNASTATSWAARRRASSRPTCRAPRRSKSGTTG